MLEGLPRVHPARQSRRSCGRGRDRYGIRRGHRGVRDGPGHAADRAVGGEPSFDDLTFTINGSEFRYGHFINALLTFVIVAAVVFYFVVKPVNALMARMKTGEDVEEPTRKCPECRSDIPGSARRCAFCTAAVQPAA